MLAEIRLSSVKISELGTDLEGVEVGVDKGRNAYSLYSVVRPKKLYLVDPWLNYVDPDSLEVIGEAQYRVTLEIVKKCPNIQIIRNDSVDAAKRFQLESLDFVYIDGDHSFEGVTRDLLTWYPKVKKGGFFGGHDIAVKGVIIAVNKFAKLNNLKLDSADGEWWVIK